MNDERLDELLLDAARSYNAPPATPPYNEMWHTIERRALSGDVPRLTHETERPAAAPRVAGITPAWLKMAAVLLIGIALGRVSIAVQQRPELPVAFELAPPPAPPSQYRAVTDRYLGETAALLIALPGELRTTGVDTAFGARADELLLQTRLLLDSPAASDPALRTLFEDLEMVLVQVVRLRASQDSTRIQLLNEALEHGDVIPRLRSAVVEHIGD